jgi:glyoxylase-like metal-dependent hydrolase (beta-lactamase superfamily II)
MYSHKTCLLPHILLTYHRTPKFISISGSLPKMKLSLFPLTILSSLALGQISHLSELNETFNPVPTVKGPTIPPSGFLTVPLGFGSYAVLDGFYQAMFVVSTEGVIVIDAPPTIGINLVFAIGNVTDKPVTHMIYSHAHADHIGSAFRFFGSHVDIIAHKETLRLLQEAPPDPRRPLPRTTFTDNFKLVVGNQTIQLSYEGENHCPGNIYIYVEAAKALMAVDIVFPGWVPFIGLADSTNIPNWIKSHEQMLRFDFNYYIGGHFDRIGTRESVVTQKEYVDDLFSNCNATIVPTPGHDPLLGAASVLEKNPGNSAAEFKVYLDLIAERCSNITNEKWGTMLGGADVWGFANAYTMVDALRISFDVLGPFGD